MSRSVILGTAAAVLVVPSAGTAAGAAGANCARTSVAMTPLTDLGTKHYHGDAGGLYANGKNTPTAPI